MKKIYIIIILFMFGLSIGLTFFLNTKDQASASTIFDTNKYDFEFIQKSIKNKESDKKCSQINFLDIYDSIYKDSIEFVAKNCIMWYTINKNRFYPDNFVRRIDFVNVLVKSYSNYFSDETKPIEIRFWKDMYTKDKNYANIQIAEYMWVLDLLIWQRTSYFEPNKFVTHSDMIRVMTFLSAIKDDIKNDGIDILEDKKNLTRWEMAFVIANSLNQIDLNKNSEDIVIQTTENLVSNQIISRFDLKKYNPMWIVSRFDMINYTTKAYIKSKTNSNNFYIKNANYFGDIVEDKDKSIFTQAKNLGLTEFWETKKWDDLYIEPQKSVTNFEAISYLNSINSKKIQYNDSDKITPLTFAKLSYYLWISFDRSNTQDTVKKSIFWLRTRINKIIWI